MSNETNFMVVTFDPTGEVSAMHRDQFSLGFLGKQSIERASEIKFNEETQKWDVWLPCIQVHDAEPWATFSYLSAFATYDSARKFEVLYLEHCALQSIAPLSQCGRELAAHLRFSYGDYAELMQTLTQGATKAQ